MRTWKEERNCRASIWHACHNRNDHNPLANHSPLGQILTDRACSGVVTTFTMVGCRNKTDMPIFKRIAVGKATDIRTANWSNRLMMQSEEFVQLLSKNGQPADHNSEKPCNERFARSAHHYRALRKHEHSAASDQRLNGYYPNSPVGCQGKATLEMRQYEEMLFKKWT